VVVGSAARDLSPAARPARDWRGRTPGRSNAKG
jgi:hypothetical protein